MRGRGHELGVRVAKGTRARGEQSRKAEAGDGAGRRHPCPHYLVESLQ